MSFISSKEHLVNYVRKVHRSHGAPFTREHLDMTLLFWEWSKHYTKNGGVNKLTWRMRELSCGISDELINTVKAEMAESQPYLNPDKVLSKEFLDEIHKRLESPGVYFLFNKEQTLLYIGRSYNLANRVLSSIKDRSSGKPHFVSFVDTETRADACILEPYFIGVFNPPMNSDMASIGTPRIKIAPEPKPTQLIKIYE